MARCRPNVMLAAPIVTLPTATARHLRADLLSRWDPHWHRLAHLVTDQLFPGSARHTLTLPPRDLQDLLVVLLDIAIDFSDGTLTPRSSKNMAPTSSWRRASSASTRSCRPPCTGTTADGWAPAAGTSGCT